MRIRQRLAHTAVIGLLTIGAMACSARSEAAPLPAGGGDGPTVSVEQMAFAPAAITVPTGSTVTWIWNSGAIAHDVVGANFVSKVQADGTFSHRFEEPGTYPYICSLHPNMTATIEVTS
jgi:plastocyanin